MGKPSHLSDLSEIPNNLADRSIERSCLAYLTKILNNLSDPSIRGSLSDIITEVLISLTDPPVDREIPGGQQYIGYYPREEERVAHRAVRDPETLGASYDRYLHNGQVPPFGPGEAARSRPMEMPRHPVDDIRVSDGRFIGYGGVRASDGRSVGYGGVRIEKQLPPDASNTLFIEGLPADCSRREVSHIFRPFPGFREVRLVSKEARHPGGDPWVLCFVDFDTPSQAAVALDSLEGYRFDEHDRDSLTLRMQFSRNPGPRSGGRIRGGRR